MSSADNPLPAVGFAASGVQQWVSVGLHAAFNASPSGLPIYLSSMTTHDIFMDTLSDAWTNHVA